MDDWLDQTLVSFLDKFIGVLHLYIDAAIILSDFRIPNEMSHKQCYLGVWRQPVAST
jgi:hypothetical protein